MKIEHVAFNVETPADVANWYVLNLGFRIVRSMQQAPFAHFLYDGHGCMVEIYKNPPTEIPNYHEMNPLQFHLAFVSEDAGADKERLLAAGASLYEEVHLPDGTHLVMLRDPWGLAIQLCKRGTPFAHTLSN